MMHYSCESALARCIGDFQDILTSRACPLSIFQGKNYPVLDLCLVYPPALLPTERCVIVNLCVNSHVYPMPYKGAEEVVEALEG